MTDRAPRAPWCCLLARFDGDDIAHARVCKWRQEPQPDALVSLSELAQEGGPQK